VDPTERDDVIVAHVYLVDIAVRRYSRDRWDDLYGYGYEGLVRGVDSWRDDRGCSLVCWLNAKIRRSILDGWRDLDPLSRSGRKRLRAFDAESDRLAQELGRIPTSHEVLLSLGAPDGAARELAAAVWMSSGSLDLTWDLAGGVAHDPLPSVEVDVVRDWLGGLIARLDNENQRVVVQLYYWHDMPMGAIARLLGVTESRVCQIHWEAVRSLQTLVEPDDVYMLAAVAA
jgi:RNA polymerase sigma factor for flagellar operon FliA